MLICCILSKFYIKPQRLIHHTHLRPVVSYRNSTSNHNAATNKIIIRRLYLIEILHQTTTIVCTTRFDQRCILSKFYIKPQRLSYLLCFSVVVSYRNSTSNHNSFGIFIVIRRLYLIEILHQTTTNRYDGQRFGRLYLIEILHQTTTLAEALTYREWLYLIEILHQTTTGRELDVCLVELYLIEILHQTTTGLVPSSPASPLYLIEILHQTTTSGLILIDKVLLTGCLPL